MRLWLRRGLKVVASVILLILLLAVTVIFGGYLISARGYQGPRSDHFDGKRFMNLRPRRHLQSAGKTLGFLLREERGPWRDWTENQHYPAPPQRIGGGNMRVTFVNHSTVLLQMDGLNILVDPIWSDRASPLPWVGPRRKRAPGLRFEDLPPVDGVLVSHSHFDHLDLPTLRRLRATHAPRVVTGLGNGSYMQERGVPGAEELDWGQSLELGNGVRIHARPSQHFAGRGLFDRNRTLWLAFVISGPAGSVYCAGDSGMAPHFEAAGREFGSFRLALLPIGAFLPRWMMEVYHLAPAEAVEAHRLLGASTSVATHFGTFALGADGQDEGMRQLEQALAGAGEPRPRFWVLDFGEGRDVP